MKAKIRFKKFCYLMHKLVLEKINVRKERAYPEYQFKPIITGLEKMEI